VAHGPQSADEVVMQVALTTSWMLRTGRHLDRAPLLHHLSDTELIDFWADDRLDADGPAPGIPSAGPPCHCTSPTPHRRTAPRSARQAPCTAACSPST
jgi:hypothetical protein